MGRGSASGPRKRRLTKSFQSGQGEEAGRGDESADHIMPNNLSLLLMDNQSSCDSPTASPVGSQCSADPWEDSPMGSQRSVDMWGSESGGDGDGDEGPVVICWPDMDTPKPVEKPAKKKPTKKKRVVN